MASAPSSTASSIPTCEPSPVDNINPRLPRVGDIFKTWDDFRFWSRKAAEVRGFTLTQSQSKGSSGTIVLRCSRFKDPGTSGQKMAQNGCEVVYKVMKAKNGLDGFEVVQSFDEHNHPFGPDTTTGHRPGTSLSVQAPKRKKIKTAQSAPTNESISLHTAPNHIVHAAATPPNSAPRPFVFDPYTGEKLPQPTTEIPSGSTPSPPTHPDSIPPAPQQPNQTFQPPQPTHPIHRAPTSLNGTPRSHSSRGISRAVTYPPPPTSNTLHQLPENRPGVLNSIPSQQPLIAHSMPKINQHEIVYKNGFSHSKIYPTLSIKLSTKAQNSITEFLTSLSPALAPYGNHFRWIGIQSPLELLELVESNGEDELDLFLDEIDTCGIGRRGEGVSQEEKVLIVSGLRKLSLIKNKS